MTRLILKILFASPLLVIMLCIISVNINLIRKNESIESSVLKELRGLKHSLNNHADAEMQQLYPEGYVFMNAIYGLAWCNFLEHHDSTGENFKEGRHEVKNTFTKINTEGKEYFEKNLQFSYGAFFNGWSTYLLGRALQLERSNQRDSSDVVVFTQQCDSIANAIQTKVYPASYYAGSWPADVVVCVASLALHDKLFQPKYKITINKWLYQVRKRIGRDGLIAHSVDPDNGFPKENARGSSQALMLIFMNEIDPRFARQQFVIFKEQFVDTKFGLTAVREYPKTNSGSGDVDSGPVIFGFGAAATIVGMQSLSIYKEADDAAQIKKTIEAFGFPWETEGNKKYAFGQFPMADAFIAWSHSGMKSGDNHHATFITFHVYCAIIFILLALFFWIIVRKEKPDSNRSLHEVW